MSKQPSRSIFPILPKGKLIHCRHFRYTAVMGRLFLGYHYLLYGNISFNPRDLIEHQCNVIHAYRSLIATDVWHSRRSPVELCILPAVQEAEDNCRPIKSCTQIASSHLAGVLAKSDTKSQIYGQHIETWLLHKGRTCRPTDRPGLPRVCQLWTFLRASAKKI